MSKTKVHVYGEEPKREGRPIEFVWYFNYDGSTTNTTIRPNNFDNVMRMPTKIGAFDIIRCWMDDLPKGIFSHYLGHWNDGFVEE